VEETKNYESNFFSS